MCNSYDFQFCNPETAFYQTNVNEFCVIALFMQKTKDIKTLCKQMIVLNEKLPIFVIWYLDYCYQQASDIYIKLSVIHGGC